MTTSTARCLARSARGLGALALAATAGVFAAPSGRDREDPIRFDFEAAGLGDTWKASGDITASRVPVPAAGDVDAEAPAGHGVHLRAGAGTLIYTKTGAVPADWSSFESISLWIHRSAEEAAARPSSTMEIQILESGRARFWRKVVLEHEGWRRVELPLRFFPWQQTRVPRWERIAHVALFFRDAAEVSIDEIRVHDEPGGPGAHLDATDVRAVAFPGTNAEQAVRTVRDGFELWVERDVVAAGVVGERLRRSIELLAPLVPPADAMGASGRVPRLLVFAREPDYRAFAPRFAQVHGVSAAEPTADGYTLLAVAHACYDAGFGDDRPTFVHEFAHSWLSCHGLLANTSEWLQEGLATLVQLRFHPQADLAQIVTDGLANQALPLAELCNGKPITVRRYWQAMTLVEALLERPRFAGKFPELIAAVQVAGSTDLGPLLEPVFGCTFDELELEWRALCAEKYAVDEDDE